MGETNIGVELDVFVKMGSIELMACVAEFLESDNALVIRSLMGLIVCALMVIIL